MQHLRATFTRHMLPTIRQNYRKREKIYKCRWSFKSLLDQIDHLFLHHLCNYYGPVWKRIIFAVLKQYYGIWWYYSIGTQKVFGLYRQNTVLNTMVYLKPWYFWSFWNSTQDLSFLLFSLHILCFSNGTKQISVLRNTMVLLW
jgi:hypothetical protein